MLLYRKRGDMKKKDAEREIRTLISVWRQQEPQLGTANEEIHCSDFIRWLRDNSPGHLKFKTSTSVEYDIEMWFDDELKQRWRI